MRAAKVNSGFAGMSSPLTPLAVWLSKEMCSGGVANVPAGHRTPRLFTWEGGPLC